ncbi:MAG: SRPBCC family protein [Pontixanthobacter sp.]
MRLPSRLFAAVSFALPLSAIFTAFPARAEVVAAADNAFVTRDMVVVSSQPREVWLALISPAKWWNAEHTFSGNSDNLTLMPKASGCFCERIPPDETSGTVGLEGSVEHMRVILAIPDQALRMQGNLGPLQSEPVDGVFTVTLAIVPEGTRLTFEYAVGGFMRFETPVIAKAVDNVMAQQLKSLSELLGPIDEDNTPVPADEALEDDTETSVDEAFGDLSREQ